MHDLYSPAEDSYLLVKVISNEIPEMLKENSKIKVVEIGSGSGILLEVLDKLGVKRNNIFSCDLNPIAVKHCRKLGFNCLESDLFQNILGKFNLIIFNPPYLPRDIREPVFSRLSTTGGKKGNETINRFIKQSKDYLEKNGKIFLLTSSLSGKINFDKYRKKLLAKEKLFFEELYVWELK